MIAAPPPSIWHRLLIAFSAVVAGGLVAAAVIFSPLI